MNRRFYGLVKDQQHRWWHNIMGVSHTESLLMWIFVLVLVCLCMHVMKWWTVLARICCSSRPVRTRKGGWIYIVQKSFKAQPPKVLFQKWGDILNTDRRGYLNSQKVIFVFCFFCFLRMGLIADNFLQFSFSQWWCTLPCGSWGVQDCSGAIISSSYPLPGYKTFLCEGFKVHLFPILLDSCSKQSLKNNPNLRLYHWT